MGLEAVGGSETAKKGRTGRRRTRGRGALLGEGSGRPARAFGGAEGKRRRGVPTRTAGWVRAGSVLFFIGRYTAVVAPKGVCFAFSIEKEKKKCTPAFPSDP